MIFLSLFLSFAQARNVQLPPFEHYRTDFNWADVGTEKNPMRISSDCVLSPIIEWQKDVCENLKALPTVFKNTFSYNLDKNYSKYWVLHVNDEPAFLTTNWGPPGQSLPVNTGLVTVNPLSNGVQLGLSNKDLNGFIPGGTPFIGYGLQADRGGGRRNVLPNSRYNLSFNVTLDEIAGDAQVGDSIHFWVQAQVYTHPFQRFPERKMLWIFLGEKNTGYNGSMKWNWPVQDSMFFPGSEIIFKTATEYSKQCGQTVDQIPLNESSVGKTFSYSFNIEQMVKCMSGWPSHYAVSIAGIHFALENNMPRLNTIKASFTDIEISKKRKH